MRYIAYKSREDKYCVLLFRKKKVVAVKWFPKDLFKRVFGGEMRGKV